MNVHAPSYSAWAQLIMRSVLRFNLKQNRKWTLWLHLRCDGELLGPGELRKAGTSDKGRAWYKLSRNAQGVLGTFPFISIQTVHSTFYRVDLVPSWAHSLWRGYWESQILGHSSLALAEWTQHKAGLRCGLCSTFTNSEREVWVEQQVWAS